MPAADSRAGPIPRGAPDNGSARVARRAGTRLAIVATPSNSTVTARNTAGIARDVWNNSDATSRPLSERDDRPAATPRAAIAKALREDEAADVRDLGA